MRTTRLHIVALMLTACYAVPAAAQSLADIAKKEEERRKDIKTPSKVLTNKDLAPAPPGSSAPAPPSAAAAGSTPADASPPSAAEGDAKDAVKDKAPKDQKYWSGRMKSLQDALSRDQVLLDAMQTRINSLTADFVNRDDPAQRAVIERNRTTALGELNRLKDQIQQDQKAIDALQEEARRAGVPAGWLR